MEDSKVNVTVGIITKQGFLIIELCLGLLLCAFLCTIIMQYQWRSISIQWQTNKRFQVIHIIEELIQTIRSEPAQSQSLFPYQKDGIMVTMTREINWNDQTYLIYLQVQWAVPAQKEPARLLVPVTIIYEKP